MFGTFTAEIRSFLSDEFLVTREVMRVYINVDCEFARQISDGSYQHINVPFHQDVFVISVAGDINDGLSRALTQLISRIDVFLHQGSGWCLTNFLRVQIDYVLSNDQVFNNIGHYADDNRTRLYGSNAGNHTAQDGAIYLKKLLFSLCSDKGDCFPIVIGASLQPYDSLKKRHSVMYANQISAFKDELVKNAFESFDFTCVESFPCSFQSLKTFARVNKDKALLVLV